MMQLFQRDLALLTRTKQRILQIRLVPMQEGDQRVYEIYVEMMGSRGKQWGQMITTKRTPQRWTSLNRAVEMLERYTDGVPFTIARLDAEAARTASGG